MLIVGGLYRELCCHPRWDAAVGSGMRSALALAKLSPGTQLYTYSSTQDQLALSELQNLGISVSTSARPTPIVFAYFHPLSTPHIQPNPTSIERLQCIHVSGESVLRFGFLEGDAVVSAERAVYDPQTWRNPAMFHANGSSAESLALVMNELEIQSVSGLQDIEQAAAKVLKDQGAEVVVVKMGTRGATVFQRNKPPSHVPAYRSNRVFKIGTGDVFSSIFSYYWAELKRDPAEAADRASRSVAHYASTRTYDFDDEILASLNPAHANRAARIRIEATVNSLGQRYTLEESIFSLRELGMNVAPPELQQSQVDSETDGILALTDGLSEESLQRIICSSKAGVPVVALHERTTPPLSSNIFTAVTDDFTTAMYLTAWSARCGN